MRKRAPDLAVISRSGARWRPCVRCAVPASADVTAQRRRHDTTTACGAAPGHYFLLPRFSLTRTEM
ncbi:hypothetical protein FHS42_004526 [Streptomyces zagrosensis]|uniref:Uncharacterized protein n=1 Tax=Streptomyces zagrosensis TaxID=1042984 RepID=A0A7W9QEA8_9ACTN|nr:hypothetical protein [Streptomyces zagrosensis]